MLEPITRSDLGTLAALYVLDLLPPQARAAVETALPDDAELAGLIERMQGRPAALPDADFLLMEGLGRLMEQVQLDEAQRDHVTAEDPALQIDLVELLALYSTLREKVTALARSSHPTTPA